MYQHVSLLRLNNILLHVYSTFWVSIQWLMGIWVISTFWLLWMMLLWTRVHPCFWSCSQPVLHTNVRHDFLKYRFDHLLSYLKSTKCSLLFTQSSPDLTWVFESFHNSSLRFLLPCNLPLWCSVCFPNTPCPSQLPMFLHVLFSACQDAA